jgi:hypothetical protein
MTTSTKGTALVTGASSGIAQRDIIKNPSLLGSYLCLTPFVM